MKPIYKVVSPVKPKRHKFSVYKFNNIVSGVFENNMKMYYSPNCYNLDLSDGSVKPCFGFDYASYSIKKPGTNTEYTYSFPVEAMKLYVKGWVYRRIDYTTGTRDDRLVIFDISGKIWQKKLFSDDEMSLVATLQENSLNVDGINYCYNGNDVMLFTTGRSGIYILNDDTITNVTNIPKFSSLCVHNERVFATIAGTKNAVWFSDEFDPSNWKVSLTEGGFIEFKDEGGSVNRAISFLDYLYIFRDFTIHKLSAYGSQEDFVLSKLYCNAGRIYPKTIAVCGNFIIFLTDSGLFRFDGYGIYPILTEIKDLFDENKDKSDNVACYHDGKYYLSTNFKLNGESYSNVGYLVPKLTSVLAYDVFDKTFTITRGVEVSEFMPIALENANLLFAMVNHDDSDRNKLAVKTDENKVYTYQLEKKWSTPYTDLNESDKVKRLVSVAFTGNGNMTLSINCDGETHDYTFNMIGKTVKIKPNLKFEKISLSFKSNDNNFKVENFAMTVDFYEKME